MKQVIDLLKKITKENYIELTSRGNTAIFSVLYCARKINPKKIVLIPDQGGWFTYKRYPFYLELRIEQVKTNYGIIDLKDLKKKIKNANCLLYSNPAGYFAEQPVKEIYNICRDKCLVILDVSGSIGLKDYSKYCDFMIGSFGIDKPVNLGYGGFIGTNNKNNFEIPKEIFNLTIFEDKYYKPLLQKLKNLKIRYQYYNKINKKIKKDLKKYDIIHRNKEGINVAVKFKDNKEKENLIEYCKKHKYPFRICPFYIRVKAKAISIEVKRL